MAKYDEDLHDNPFFITLSDKYSQLFTLAAEKCWVVCIPRIESISRLRLHRQDFENHILIPDQLDSRIDSSYSVNVDSNFVTFNGKHLTIKGDTIITGTGFKEEKHVKILFDESFFNSKDESYQILCIDQLIEGGPEEYTSMIASLETVADCHAFLWSDSTSDKVKRAVDISLTSCRVPWDSTPDQIKDIAYSFYDKALNEISRLPHFRRIQNMSGKQFLLLATETYVLDKLHPLLFRILCKSNLGDAAINKITRRACDVQAIDLGIRSDYLTAISKAKKCLRRLNKCLSPFEKIRCFKDTISTLASLHGSSHDALTADELLPMLVYLVLTSEIPNWKSNLFFVQEFHFSQVGSEEVLYYLTSFEAAVEYITGGSLEKNTESLIKRARLPKHVNATTTESSSINQEINTNDPDISDFNTKDANISDSNTIHANISDLNTIDVNISDLNTIDANISDLNTIEANINDANISDLNTIEASVNDANISDLNTIEASVNDANISDLNTIDANIRDFNTIEAINDVNISDLNTIEASVNDANISDLNTIEASVNDANINDLNTTDTNISDHNTIEAINDFNTIDTNISEAQINDANISDANISDHNTIEANINDPNTNISDANNSNFASNKTDEVLVNTSLTDNTIDTRAMKLSSYFDSVKRQDVSTLEKILLKLPDDMTKMLCHPLCDCDKCAPIIQSYHDSLTNIGVHSHDLLFRTGLHYAALLGYESIVQRLIELKCEIDASDINKQTPLHLACLHGNQKCVLYLLSEGASINKTDKYGNTPLHLACSHGHEECVKALVFHKETCLINVKNHQGDTPLHLAARWNYILIITLLLEHNADRLCRNALEETAYQSTYNTKISLVLHPSHPKVTRTEGQEMIEKGEVKMRESRSSTTTSTGGGGEGEGGSSRSNQKNKRRSSLFSDVSSETDRQMKKLFRAINDHDITMVKFLFGSREGIVQSQGEASSIAGTTDICHPLCQCEKCLKLKKGYYQPVYLTVHTCDSRGNTPLHKAALHGGHLIVSYLLERGAPRNARTKDELVTPLHLACQYNHKDVVMILLENGADVNPREIRGSTPLHFCCNNGHMDSAALLLIHGADVTAVNDRGDTPLHNAARWNHSSLVRELILYGAQYTSRNNEDKTPDDLTTDDEVHRVIEKARLGEITTGAYVPLVPRYSESPRLSDDEIFEHV